MFGVDVAELLTSVLTDQSLDGIPVTSKAFFTQEGTEFLFAHGLNGRGGSFLHGFRGGHLGFFGLGIGRVGVEHGFRDSFQTVGQGTDILNDIQQELYLTH